MRFGGIWECVTIRCIGDRVKVVDGTAKWSKQKMLKKLTFSGNMKLKIAEHEVTMVLNVA